MDYTTFKEIENGEIKNEFFRGAVIRDDINDKTYVIALSSESKKIVGITATYEGFFETTVAYKDLADFIIGEIWDGAHQLGTLHKVKLYARNLVAPSIKLPSAVHFVDETNLKIETEVRDGVLVRSSECNKRYSNGFEDF